MNSTIPRSIEADAPTVLSIATALPPHVLEQSEVVALAPRLFDRTRSEIERLMPVFHNAGIVRRYSCVPIDWYLSPHGWQERNRLYIDSAIELLSEAADEALSKAKRRPQDIAAVVLISTTGLASPSLDALLFQRLGLPASVLRLPVIGLGCAGGVVGLSHAAALARSGVEGDVLFLAVELCALTFRQGDMSKSNIIATALFGDGATAMVIGRPGSTGIRIGPSGMQTWRNSLDVMGWHVEDDGLGVLFSRDIPTLVRRDLGPVVDAYLARHHLSLPDVAGFICHPGGVKVLDALEHTFRLEPGAMWAAREVLRDHGNMSAVTVLFVLQKTMEAGFTGRHLMAALGPGFTAGLQLLET